ncbi:MAG TPA: hypothetical protein ENI15_02280 [Spirochaetes bacterium]|nr:hypothetical protein [Spirochaetota bacterium]
MVESQGTFFLVFAGTGAIIVDTITGGVLGHTGVAIIWGLIVMVLIYTNGDISGAHMNPAVPGRTRQLTAQPSHSSGREQLTHLMFYKT